MCGRVGVHKGEGGAGLGFFLGWSSLKADANLLRDSFDHGHKVKNFINFHKFSTQNEWVSEWLNE